MTKREMDEIVGDMRYRRHFLDLASIMIETYDWPWCLQLQTATFVSVQCTWHIIIALSLSLQLIFALGGLADSFIVMLIGRFVFG